MRTKLPLLLALASVLSVSTAFATTLRKMSLDDMAQSAPVAIVGEVTASRTVQRPDGPYTLVTVTVQESLWGPAPTSVVVATPGGPIAKSKARVASVVAGAPVLLMRERALLLLTPDAAHGGYSIVGFDQGLMPVMKTSRGDAVMLPGLTRPMMLREATTKIRAMRSEVR